MNMYNKQLQEQRDKPCQVHSLQLHQEIEEVQHRIRVSDIDLGIQECLQTRMFMMTKVLDYVL